jgi:Dolichyl-phosphate-mannose-protein mannosyltransferase
MRLLQAEIKLYEHGVPTCLNCAKKREAKLKQLTNSSVRSAQRGGWELFRYASEHLSMDGLSLALLILGTGLRLWQYVGNPSLVLDELALARNILDRSIWSLVSMPLSYDQVAPKGFLLIEKLASSTLGPSDYVLRLFPQICALIALVAFWRLAKAVLGETSGTPIAVALFATAVPLVVLSSFVKQYSTDVAAAVFLTWLGLDLQRHITIRRALWAGLGGACAVWFSQATIFILFAVGTALLVAVFQQYKIKSSQTLALVAMLSMWGGRSCSDSLGFG